MSFIVVLEQSILDSITARDAELASGISVFPHPLPPDLLDEPPSRSIDTDAPIKIGLLGLCTPQKGLFRFLELAKYAKSSQVNRLEFEIIGRLHKDVISRAEPYMQYLHRPPANKIMPREEFVAAASNLHFAVFLFDGNYYNVTASGVSLDCIALGVPVIADSSELIHRLEREVGPIGLTDSDYFTSEALIGHLKNLDHAYSGIIGII